MVNIIAQCPNSVIPTRMFREEKKRKGVETWVRLKASTLGKVVISFYILKSIPKHQCILDELMALMVSKQLQTY
jgi:hypothetical protein